jgi:hypothetical protein
LTGFIEDCTDVNDLVWCESNDSIDECNICGGEGPQVLCSDGSTTCTQNQCPDLVADHFILEYDLDSIHEPMTFYITSAILDGEDLETGDEIGVFDGDVCVGVGVVDGVIEAPNNMLEIIVSAQNGNIPGYTTGNDISFRFWDLTVPEEIIEMEVVYLEGNGLFGQPGDEFYLNLIGETEFEKPGCMDESACNYDPEASIDDGSCLLITCENGVCAESQDDCSICPIGEVDDCSGDGDCCDENWIGDEYDDCQTQQSPSPEQSSTSPLGQMEQSS